MIISPPFLPAGAPITGGADEEDAYLKLAMVGGSIGQGGYPLSHSLTWHGGLHLISPSAGNGPGLLPVVAVADGTILFARGSPEKDACLAKDHPLNYHQGFSSNGVVVIKHDTEIGEGVPVTFYSIYMHLSTLAKNISTGTKVWRKDELGSAGFIYGQPNQIHFEIVCDSANLAKLVGRATGPLKLSEDGRKTCVWGEVYYLLPSSPTKVFNEDLPKAQKKAAASTDAHDPAVVTYQKSIAGKGDAEIKESIIVGIRYEKGSCIKTSYKLDGTVIGTVTDTGYEYTLFEESTSIYPKCPSAGYELLRFGRVLGPDELDPVGAEHWRKIAHPTGQGFVNLNAEGIYKFSDADFPPWKAWSLIDDDKDANSRCDSQKLIAMISKETKPEASALLKLAATDPVQKSLTHAICLFPSEWDDRNADALWSWLKDDGAFKLENMTYDMQEGRPPFDTGADYDRFKAHLSALAFWSQAGLSSEAYWHFEPREFIRTFRRCGWLSQKEMLQLFPTTAMRQSKGAWVSEAVTPSIGNLSSNRTPLNKLLRKFGVVTPVRMGGFYANAFVETGWLRLVEESLNSKNLPRYFPWQGRGFMQLTWPANYIKYWRFLGRSISKKIEDKLNDAAKTATSSRSNASLADSVTGVTTEIAKWRDDVSSAVDAAASAGAYWAWSGAAQHADTASAYVRESKIASGKTTPYYTHSSFGRVAATVNNPGSTSYSSVNGIVARFQAFTSSAMVLMDTPQFPDSSGNNKDKPDEYLPRRP